MSLSSTTGNPLAAYSNNRTDLPTATPVSASIQPFEIVEIDGQGHLSQHFRIPTDEATEQSLTTNTLVALSSRDGHQIAHSDSQAAVRSTHSGLHLSNHIDRKVLLSNYDQPVFDSNYSSSKSQSFAPSAPPAPSNDIAQHSRHGGYSIPEYRSIYEDPVAAASTSYEYKSIYDS